ncbi:phage tail protein [Pseudomonas moraviensis]|uniref:phage tail protein n=1 Tax=Pseudomonas moraviensis TaxID=321662 RepID=UPI000A9DCE1C|nr:phage tail protein [Pseudomonas moraviensis]
MPWYKTGTVSVTQNSNAVIGAGTAFIANSRVGDGFRGPDGRWYEVTNIASNTALSISPNYEGPTATGGFYSIMPVQGYQKDLSDQVRAILNDYGEKLAALGTTGNYDTLPVTKGGTGGEDQASARLGLEAAKSGANSDITELSGLTKALSVGQGGTGGKTPAEARAGIGLGPTSSLAIGAVEITAALPFIDFHFNNTATDYDVRLINSAAGTLNALVGGVNEFRVNSNTVWNDGNATAKIIAIGVGGIGSYGFFFTSIAAPPGTSVAGWQLIWGHSSGQGALNPAGTWRSMGDCVASGRTLFQRIS